MRRVSRARIPSRARVRQRREEREAASAGASSISARYWRLEITAWSAWTEAHVSEIELALLGQTKHAPSSIGATSNYSGFPASNAIDGDSSTSWIASNSTQPQRLTLDYGAPVEVNVLRLRGRSGGAITAFKLQHSDDNSTWTTVIDLSGLTTATEDALKSYPLPDITAGGKILWRLRATAIDGGSTLSIAELVLRGEADGMQAATGGRPYAKDINGGLGPALAFDDDAATHWNGNSVASWLAYEFPNSQDVVQFTVQSRTSVPSQSPKDFVLEYSSDGATWTAAKTLTGETGWTSGQARTYAIP